MTGENTMQSIAKAMMGSFGLVLIGWTITAEAQEWPKQRPVTFVVAFGPGAVTDTLARLIGQKVAESLGQTVVVDNRPGAGGNIGAQRVKSAAPDGYTVLITSVAYAINPSLFANAGYDPLKDFIPLILVGTVPNAISVHPSVPARNLQELIKLARQQPLAYATPGIGTSGHLTMERIKAIAKIDVTHVPFQPAQAVTAVLGGQLPVLGISVTLTLPHAKSGKLRPLAVTSAQRAPSLPDVLTINEQGFKGFDDLNWFAFFTPAGVPPEIVNRLNAEINRVLELPDIKEKFGQQGLESRRNTAAEFTGFIREEVTKWAKAVTDSGAKAD
jgi:tripartite-type tricarboxylate transporter receptor subunit TctC